MPKEPDHLPDADIPRMIRTHTGPPKRTVVYLEAVLREKDQEIAALRSVIDHYQLKLAKFEHSPRPATAKGSA